MKTFSDKVLDVLESHWGLHYKISHYMKHLVIEVPEDTNFEKSASMIKKSVKECLEKYLPEREDNILFDVRNSFYEKSFKIYKGQQPEAYRAHIE